MPRDERHTATIPYGTLGIIPLASCTKMGEKVDKFLVDWREQREHENESTLAFNGYKRDSYILKQGIEEKIDNWIRNKLFLYDAGIHSKSGFRHF